jgi:hypothetical protein
MLEISKWLSVLRPGYENVNGAKSTRVSLPPPPLPSWAARVQRLTFCQSAHARGSLTFSSSLRKLGTRALKAQSTIYDRGTTIIPSRSDRSCWATSAAPAA